jgi:hypothetical protein
VLNFVSYKKLIGAIHVNISPFLSSLLLTSILISPAFGLTAVQENTPDAKQNPTLKQMETKKPTVKPAVIAPITEPVLQCMVLEPIKGELKFPLTAPITQLVSAEGQISELSPVGDTLRTFDYKGVTSGELLTDRNWREFVDLPIYTLVADSPTKHFFQVKPGDSVIGTTRVLFKLNIRGRRLKYPQNGASLLRGSLNICVK